MAAAAAKYSLLAVMLVLIGLAADTQMAAAQNCSAGLGMVTVCAPYVVPGAASGPPSQECCSALRGMDNTCICNTIDIVNRLPASCSLPPITCPSS